jgi:hypothetical protein
VAVMRYRDQRFGRHFGKDGIGARVQADDSRGLAIRRRTMDRRATGDQRRADEPCRLQNRALNPPKAPRPACAYPAAVW